MVSLSTPGTKGANCFSQNINRISKGGLTTKFTEWFRGFTDAEGCFLIVKQSNSFAFRFIIKIHKDDINLLYYIKNSLNDIGNVGTEGNLAHFKVTSISEIKTIIDIFTAYPLNSSKHLDFLGFRKAYELYTTSSRENLNEVVKEISYIKESMNSKRTEYKGLLTDTNSAVAEYTHRIYITDDWLLGFIEGDGSFSITKKDYILTFSISQKGNLALMKAIQSYLLNTAVKLKTCAGLLGELKDGTRSRNVVYITKSKNKYVNVPGFTEYNYVLIVKSREFVNNVIIPYLNLLTFHSKKELDYLD